jgi:hypothetical protein
MKIHSQKIKDDFELYFADLEKSVASSLRKHREGQTQSVFKEVYPLFVMLETLYNPDYFSDPSTLIEFQQCMQTGDKQKITKAIARLSDSKARISDELRKGIAQQLFTPYFKELYSDTFLLTNQYYLNNYRGCYLYLRGILEDVYKHIYYIDHKQEFTMVASGKSEFGLKITPRFLREYLKKTSHLCGLNNLNCDLEKIDYEDQQQNKETLFSLNRKLYHRASAFVHPSRQTHMSHFSSNSDLVFNEENAKEVCKVTRDVVKVAVVFLICVHFQQFVRFNEYEKSLVMYSFDEIVRRNLRRNLRV